MRKLLALAVILAFAAMLAGGLSGCAGTARKDHGGPGEAFFPALFAGRAARSAHRRSPGGYLRPAGGGGAK